MLLSMFCDKPIMCCAVLFCRGCCQAVFEEMDLDHDGVITGQQLHEGLARMGATISERDVAEFLKVSKVGCTATAALFKGVLNDQWTPTNGP